MVSPVTEDDGSLQNVTCLGAGREVKLMVFLTTLMIILCSWLWCWGTSDKLNSVFDKSMYLGKSPLRLSFYVNSPGSGRRGGGDWNILILHFPF